MVTEEGAARRRKRRQQDTDVGEIGAEMGKMGMGKVKRCGVSRKEKGRVARREGNGRWEVGRMKEQRAWSGWWSLKEQKRSEEMVWGWRGETGRWWRKDQVRGHEDGERLGEEMRSELSKG